MSKKKRKRIFSNQSFYILQFQLCFLANKKMRQSLPRYITVRYGLDCRFGEQRRIWTELDVLG